MTETEYPNPPAEKRTNARPTYILGVIGDELPVQDSGRTGGGGSRASQWLKVLAPIVADPDFHNSWIEVAQYTTSNGALLAKKGIVDLGRDIPDGTWLFDVRRFSDENGDRVSNLYAKYVTEAAA